MPLINVKVIEGVFSSEQRQDMVRRVTDALTEIEGENRRRGTWCLVEEITSGDWGSVASRCTRPTPRRWRAVDHAQTPDRARPTGAGSLTAEEVPIVAAKTNRVLVGMAPRAQWVQSFVTSDTSVIDPTTGE